MNLNQYLLSAVLILGLPSVAVADAPQNYWGFGIDGIDLEAMTSRGTTVMGSAESDMNGFNLRYGLWLPFDLIAIEVRIGNLSEKSGTMIGDPEVRYVFGMGKLNLPFESVNLYVMGGVSKAFYNYSGGEKDSGEDVVGGVGIELLGSETTGLTIEFLKYGVNDDDIEGEIITIGFNHRFELPGFR